MVLLLTTFFFILIIGFLVFIHELGHFLAAKVSGIYVQEFAIGFGPSLLSIEKGGTHYKINALPLGGYVQLEGEESVDAANGFRNKPYLVKVFVLSAGVIMNVLVALVLLGISLANSNNNVVLQKFGDFTFSNTEEQFEFLPIFVGEISEDFGWANLENQDVIVKLEDNLVVNENDFTTFINNNKGDEVSITILDFEDLVLEEKEITIGGLPSDYNFALYLSVPEDSRSEDQIEDGSVVVEVNGETFDSVEAFLDLLEANEGNNVPFTYINEETLEVYTQQVEVFEENEEGLRLGVGLEPYVGLFYDSGFTASSIGEETAYYIEYKSNVLSVFAYMWDTLAYQLLALGSIFGDAFQTGEFEQVGESTGGVVRVFSTTRDLVSLGLMEQLVTFAALISLSLAVFNILPFPALDGGQIALYGIEAVRGKPLPDELVNRVNFLGFMFLMLLFVIVTINDLRQINAVESVGSLLKSFLGR